jgi:hypothetical protein
MVVVGDDQVVGVYEHGWAVEGESKCHRQGRTNPGKHGNRAKRRLGDERLVSDGAAFDSSKLILETERDNMWEKSASTSYPSQMTTHRHQVGWKVL